MRDLAILMPSRRRPGRLSATITAALGLSAADTDLIAGIDDDDPEKPGYDELAAALRSDRRVGWRHGPRLTLGGWINKLALEFAPQYHALAFLGDDHMARTPGWDAALLTELDRPGAILAYGDDLFQSANLPTALVIRSAVVTALGWMALPGAAHYYLDDAWKALAGPDAWFCPHVIIEHLHPDTGKSATDTTYIEAVPSWGLDEAAFRAWYDGQRETDMETARKAAAR